MSSYDVPSITGAGTPQAKQLSCDCRACAYVFRFSQKYLRSKGEKEV